MAADPSHSPQSGTDTFERTSGNSWPSRDLGARPSSIRRDGATRTTRAARSVRSSPATVAAGAVGRRPRAWGPEPQGGGQEVAWQGELVPVRGLLDLRDAGLRLFAHERLSAQLQRCLHLGLAGEALLASTWRCHRRCLPAGRAKRKIPGSAADRLGVRDDSGRGP